jgi:uncharacterized membrane protein YczE
MASRWRPSPSQLVQVLIGCWIFGMGEALVVASELGNSTVDRARGGGLDP